MLKKSVIKNDWGSLIIYDEIDDARNGRIARDFLKRLILSVLKKSHKFYVAYNKEDYPLHYNERSMITPCHLAELPTTRMSNNIQNTTNKQTANMPSAGRFDLWCYYRKTDFIIELKRTYCVSRLITTSRVESYWNKLSAQIDALEDYAKEFAYDFIRVGILTVWVYEGSQSAKKKNIDEIARKINGKFKASGYAPSWSAIWIPPNRQIEYVYYDDENNRQSDRCIGVLFFVYLPRSSEGYA
jgi:hypothetical protein